MIVDAVSSFGGMDIHPSDVHADIFVAGPSKCRGGAPGLTFVTVSDRPWVHIACRWLPRRRGRGNRRRR